MTGNPTCTEFGTLSPVLKFSDDVDGASVASPGGTDKNLSAEGRTMVTFNNAPVPPGGASRPVICNFCETADANGSGNPTIAALIAAHPARCHRHRVFERSVVLGRSSQSVRRPGAVQASQVPGPIRPPRRSSPNLRIDRLLCLARRCAIGQRRKR